MMSTTMPKRHNKKIWSSAILHFLMLIMVFICLYPFLLMLMGSFKSRAEIIVNAAGIPRNPTFENFVTLFNYNSGVITRSFLNSLFVSTSYTVLTLIIASLAAFAFGKLEFKGRNLLFVFLLATMMVPMEVNIAPLYLMYSKLGWLNSYQVQIIPGLANVFAMFMFKQYIEGIPNAILESATLDGSGYLRTYSSIVLPSITPAIGALAIITYLGKWNDYLIPKTMINRTMYMPIMVALPQINDDTNATAAVPWELMLTACLVATLPLVIVFIIFQDKFMDSVTMGAVKE